MSGAPAVALIGGFYVADLTGSGRAGAVAARAAMMMAVVMAANVAGLHVTARVAARASPDCWPRCCWSRW